MSLGLGLIHPCQIGTYQALIQCLRREKRKGKKGQRKGARMGIRSGVCEKKETQADRKLRMNS